MRILGWFARPRPPDLLRAQGRGTAAFMRAMANHLEQEAERALKSARLLREAARAEEARTELAAQVYEYGLSGERSDPT